MKLALRLSLLIAIVAISFGANAQKYTIDDFYKIDSLAKEGQPKTALELIDKINEQARRQNNAPLLIKSVVYRMLFQSYLEEDAFDRILVGLRKDIDLAQQPEKSILQSLLAEMYWQYYQQNSYRIASRTNVQGDIGDDIKTWSIPKITNEIVKYFLLSLSQQELLQNTKIDRYDQILSGDKHTRSLRPTLYDLLAHRAIDIFTNTQLSLTQADDDHFDFGNPKWSAPTQSFLTLQLPKSDSTLFNAEAMQLFKTLSQFHFAQQNKAALADVELKRLKFVFQHNNSDDKSETYYQALQRLADESSATEIYADILYEQALLHKDAQLQIDSNKLNLLKAVELANKAIKGYPKSQGAINADNLIKQIAYPELNMKIKGVNLPHKPFQLHFSYKNLDTVYFRLYSRTATERTYIGFNEKKDYEAYFAKKKPVKEWMMVLPKQSDYQTHTLIAQTEGLAAGRYLLLASESLGGSDKIYSAYLNFNISALAVTDRLLNGQHEYIVSSAINGNPLKNIKIIQKRQGNGGLLYDSEILTTNENGYASTYETHNVYRAVIADKKDSLGIDLNNYSYKYRPQKRMVLFTDRPIYRPGQQVYYKGLFILNENSASRILPHEKVALAFKDANYEDIQKIEATTNEYGTFQGVFTIPMGKLNGQMWLQTDFGSLGVQVEEYKRPTFEVVFDKADQKYKLNDSVSVRGTALAYAGYAVSGAKVKYKVSRQEYQPFYDNYFRYRYTPPKQIAIGQTTTKDGGKFDFNFFAKANNTSLNYTYEISVEITDANGETRTNTKTINVGKKDILLSASVPEQLFAEHMPDSISYNLSNLNYEPIKGSVTAEWALLQAPARLTNKGYFEAEKYTLSREDFIKVFPNDDYNDESNPAKWPVKSVLFKQQSTGNQNKMALEGKLPDGFYRVKFTGINTLNDTVSLNKIVRVYAASPATIQNSGEWLVPEKTRIAPNEEAIFRVASILANSKGYYEVYQKDSVTQKTWFSLSPKQSIIRIKPNPKYGTDFAVQFTLVQDGTIYNSLQNVTVADPSKELDIKFLTFRNKLQPGEKESWKLQIGNKKGEKEMAELVATLFDASLNDLKKMTWPSNLQTAYNYQTYNWNFGVGNLQMSNYFWFLKTQPYYNPQVRSYENLNFFGFNYFGGYNYAYHNYINKLASSLKSKSSSDVQKSLAQLAKGALLYGVITDNAGIVIPGAFVTVNGTKTVANQFGIYSIKAKAGDNIKVTYLGYVTFNGKVGKNKRLDITLNENGNALDQVVVRGAAQAREKRAYLQSTTLSAKELVQEAPAPVALEERRESNADLLSKVSGLQVTEDGKLLADTSIKFGGGVATNTPIVPRTNFNETAFFYPQLHTNENGEINIEFTIPQSLTRYQMMGFAHTKDLKTASVSKELITQKQLAISANAPRFFREGDTIVFSAKLNNLSGKQLQGTAHLELRDALTGKVVDLAAPGVALNPSFDVKNTGNEVLKWPLVIPSGLSAITYKVIAQAGNYSDGEEMTIPVLPNSMLVTETMPLNVRGNTTKVFNLEKLQQSGSSRTMRNQSLTFEFTSNPVWYAVQALPYLMEYPYECAEQTFSRFYANSFATGIINSSPKIKQVFEQWQRVKNGEALLSNLEKNQELKSILLEETPWVRQADNETERKKRLAVLFDLNRMTYELKSNFEKLEKMQLSNGSFPWFTGMNEDRYITQHIVLGMSQLQYLKLVDEKSYPNFNSVLSKAIGYLDQKLVQDYKNELEGKGTAYLPLHYLYVRSYGKAKNTNGDFAKAQAYYLNKISQNWLKMDSYQLAQTALVLHRNGKQAIALKIINLLKQTAQQSDEMGMYWANNKSGWWWYQSPIETQAILIEAFDEVAADSKSVEEMKIWLLKNKQTNDWKTTKATAAACYALLMRGYNLLAESATPGILIGNKTLADLGFADAPKEAGTGYQKVSIAGPSVQPQMGRVEIKNNNQTIAWGALYWQYFEQLDKITPAATGIKINKKLFLQKQSDKGDILTPLTAANMLSPGDLVKVRIEIVADRAMEYVHLKDMRSSGFEPVNVISRYKYQDGLGYYESTKDASTNFFIGYLPKGTYVFEYPLRVSHSGSFSNGITSLQSMYAPELATHSQGIRVTVK